MKKDGGWGSTENETAEGITVGMTKSAGLKKGRMSKETLRNFGGEKTYDRGT